MSAAGFNQLLRTRGRTLQILSGISSGQSCRALVDRVGALEFASEFRKDSRGKRVMEILKFGAPVIKSQDRFKDLKNKEVYVVLQAEYDCPDFTLKFIVKQLSDKDQA